MAKGKGTPPKEGGNSNKKKASEPSNMLATEEIKRPGSAVSQQFQPKKQQNVSNAWRKHEEQQKQQNGAPFGYVPFKSAPLPIYGIRGSTLSTGKPAAQRNHQILNPAEYMHSTYAPPQALRPESAMAPRETGNLPARGGVESRPGSELGMYLPSKMPSRYQSYTTLPRPEHVELDGEFQQHSFRPQPPPPSQFSGLAGNDIYGMSRGKSPTPAFYAEKQNIYGVSQLLRRPPSAMSNNRGPFLPYLGGAYPLPHPSLLDEDVLNRVGIKQIVDWGSLNLSSCLQILFGSCIFALGVARMFLRADYAKGQELFYGISVVCAGLVGYFAVRHRSYSMAVFCFVLSIINAVLVFVPFLSGILPLIPLLTAASSGKPSISITGTNEPIEVDLALAILSLLQFSASLIVGVFGCRAFGSTIGHVEKLRLQQSSQSVRIAQSTEKEEPIS